MRKLLLIPTGKAMVQDIFFFLRNYTIAVVAFTSMAILFTALQSPPLVTLSASLLISAFILTGIYGKHLISLPLEMLRDRLPERDDSLRNSWQRELVIYQEDLKKINILLTTVAFGEIPLFILARKEELTYKIRELEERLEQKDK